MKYRIERAWETLDDAEILAHEEKWNSCINRLYYAAFYAINALLLHHGQKPTTHAGIKLNFSQNFIKTNKIPKTYGKIFSQLSSWRQKGDYGDLIQFTKENALPYFTPIEELIKLIENEIS